MAELIIVGIQGLAEHGKDTIAKTLTLFHGFFRVALGDPIKAAIRDAGDDITKQRHKAGMADRTAWQQLGTEARNDVGAPDVWVDLNRTLIQYFRVYHPEPISRFVVPDTRYGPECDSLRTYAAKHGGQFHLLRVHRPGHQKIAGAAHSSEQLLGPPPDVTLVNDGAVIDLVTKTLEWALSIGLTLRTIQLE